VRPIGFEPGEILLSPRLVPLLLVGPRFRLLNALHPISRVAVDVARLDAPGEHLLERGQDHVRLLRRVAALLHRSHDRRAIDVLDVDRPLLLGKLLQNVAARFLRRWLVGRPFPALHVEFD
jgi:hypothetical protein